MEGQHLSKSVSEMLADFNLQKKQFAFICTNSFTSYEIVLIGFFELS